jgi:hypothetical protein
MKISKFSGAFRAPNVYDVFEQDFIEIWRRDRK